LQVDEGLPIYVIPLEPEERVLEQLRASQNARRQSDSVGERGNDAIGG
jgi:hypothetical protein